MIFALGQCVGGNYLGLHLSLTPQRRLLNIYMLVHGVANLISLILNKQTDHCRLAIRNDFAIIDYQQELQCGSEHL